LLDIHFDLSDGDSTFIQNVDRLLPHHTQYTPDVTIVTTGRTKSLLAKVFESRVPRTAFGPRIKEGTRAQ
jgi:hypothetical protein